MICSSNEGRVSFQKKDLEFTYPFYEDWPTHYYAKYWHEELYKERGQTYLAPLVLVRWS